MSVPISSPPPPRPAPRAHPSAVTADVLTAIEELRDAHRTVTAAANPPPPLPLIQRWHSQPRWVIGTSVEVGPIARVGRGFHRAAQAIDSVGAFPETARRWVPFPSKQSRSARIPIVLFLFWTFRCAGGVSPAVFVPAQRIDTPMLRGRFSRLNLTRGISPPLPMPPIKPTRPHLVTTTLRLCIAPPHRPTLSSRANGGAGRTVAGHRGADGARRPPPRGGGQAAPPFPGNCPLTPFSIPAPDSVNQPSLVSTECLVSVIHEKHTDRRF